MTAKKLPPHNGVEAGRASVVVLQMALKLEGVECRPLPD